MKQPLALFFTTLTLAGTSAAGIGPLGLGQTASAHMMETNYNLLDQALEFTSTFSTGEPVPEANVSIYAPNNLEQPWLELTSDEYGRFSFTPDQSIPGDWEIHIEKGIGHQDFWTVPVNPTGIDFNNIVMDTNGGAGEGNQVAWAGVATILGLSVAAGIATYKRRCS